MSEVETQLGLFESRRLRDEGVRQVKAHNDGLYRRLLEYAIEQSQRHGCVDSDEVRLYAQTRGWYPKHRNFWGCIFRDKHWKLLEYRPSRIVTNHSRMIRVWRWENE